MPNATLSDFLAKGYTLKNGVLSPPNATAAPLATRLPNAVLKPLVRRQPLEADRHEKGSRPRTRVCVTRYARRLLDVDNLGGAKLVIDQLRYAKLIQDDSPEHIDLELRQVKVASKAEEGTEIVISPE